MTEFLRGVTREQLAAAEDPDEGMRIALEPACRLKDAYGKRLRQVVLFGSWVRGEAHGESDVDLLVVLGEVASRTQETDRIVDVLFDPRPIRGERSKPFR